MTYRFTKSCINVSYQNYLPDTCPFQNCFDGELTLLYLHRLGPKKCAFILFFKYIPILQLQYAAQYNKLVGFGRATRTFAARTRRLSSLIPKKRALSAPPPIAASLLLEIGC
jgi:hypothetical protein